MKKNVFKKKGDMFMWVQIVEFTVYFVVFRITKKLVLDPVVKTITELITKK